MNLNPFFKSFSRLLFPDPIWIVGGAVRDRWLNRPVSDFDLVIIKDPYPLAQKLARQFHVSVFRLDDQFGVARIIFKSGIQIDITKMQGRDFSADLDRRDFSINALAVPLTDWMKANWKKSIVDEHRGLDDLTKGQIRSLSERAFRSDPLRLLRAYRIAAELSFNVARDTQTWIKRNAHLIRKPAPERIRFEMLKLFSVERSHPFVSDMAKSGLLESLLPELKPMKTIGEIYYGRGGVLKHTLDSLMLLEDILQSLGSWFPGCQSKLQAYLSQSIGGAPRSAHLKWACLLHDLGKPKTADIIDGRLRFFEHEHIGAQMIPKLSKRFRWSSDETELYGRMVRHHMRPGNLAAHDNISDKALHRFFRDLGEDAVGMLLVSLGDHLSYLTPKQRKARRSPHEKLTQRMVRIYYRQRDKVLPPRIIDGYDVMKVFNLKPSPLIGELLREAQEAQSEGTIKTKDQALKYLREKLPEIQRKYPSEN